MTLKNINHINGLVAAPFTPMKQDGSVNLEVIPELFEIYKKNGITGVFVNGSTGEGLELTTKERMELTEAWSDTVQGEFDLLVHVGHSSLEEAKSLSKQAANCDFVTGISTVGPFYRKPDRVERLVEFCKEVAISAQNIPFYYYHIPILTGINIPMYDFIQVASKEISTFSGIKYSHHDLVDFSRCLHYEDQKYDIIFGNDELLSCGLTLGAKGFIGSTYNLFPSLYHQIIEAFDNGDMSTVQFLQNKAMKFVGIIDKYGYAAAAKQLMKHLGVDCGPARLPLHTNGDSQIKELVERLSNEGFFKYSFQEVSV